jgi:acetyltransferase
MEGPHDGRRLFEAARAVAKKKPIVMIKSGRTEAGEKAARSHTG